MSESILLYYPHSSAHFIALRERLRINDSYGEAQAIVLPDLPPELKKRCLRYVQTAYPGILRYTDSKKEGSTTKYRAFHIDSYFRFIPSVSLSLISSISY